MKKEHMPHNRFGRLMKETAGFSYEFIRHPKNVGSVIPSSRMLARAMRRTAQHYGHPDSLVIEAGAGTGAITRELVAHYPADRLLISEASPGLARRLGERFRGSDVRCGRVEELGVWAEPQAKTIVSSLPFRSLPPEVSGEIIRVFCKALRDNPDNVLVQFTYGQKSPLPLPPDCGVSGEKTGYAWLNFPPARIWVYRAQR